MPPIAIDLLIEARWTIPVAPSGRVLENHAIAIDHGRIVAVLPQNEASLRYAPRQTTRLPHHALIPGLVNLHTHAAMALLKGIADDRPLMEWLQQHIWPIEAKHVSPDFVRDGSRLACAEMLRGGTTCFADMYFFPSATAEAAAVGTTRQLSSSRRCHGGRTIEPSGKPTCVQAATALADIWVA